MFVTQGQKQQNITVMLIYMEMNLFSRPGFGSESMLHHLFKRRTPPVQIHYLCLGIRN